MRAGSQKIVVLLSLSLIVSIGCASTKVEIVDRFAATAQAAGIPTTGSVATVNIDVYRYATEGEIAALAQVLREEGSRALLKALREHNMGNVSAPTRTGFPLRLVMGVDTPEGRRILALTDRPITFYEVRTSARSRRYEFGFLDLTLDARGQGTGTLIAAGKVTLLEGDTIEVESFGVMPVRLMNVRAQ
jgi:hypothetical protein